jgi:FdrA protein
MSVVRCEIRRGAYFDSVVLLQIQKSLLGLEGVEEAGVAMATPANREILAESGLLTEEAAAAQADDLLIAVRARHAAAAATALAAIDELLRSRQAAASGDDEEDPRPRSLATAMRARPEADWVLVSVPGRYAAAVAGEALAGGRNVFLYSDNVTLQEEVDLKRRAAKHGLLVLGPDCGTTMLGGVGLGFSNRVRRGAIGIVAASGTGLQAVASRIHEQGEGVSHGLGTGGRDLSEEVGGATALAALERLRLDDATRVIVLLSKPPAPEVATRLLAAARDSGKPVVIHFIGHVAPGRRLGNLRFATSLAETADLAVALARGVGEIELSATSDFSARPPLLGSGEVAGPLLTHRGASLEGETAQLADENDGIAELQLGPDLAAGVLSTPYLEGREGGGMGGRGDSDLAPSPRGSGERLVRGLFSGGTLAYEALLALRAVLGRVDSNLSHDEIEGDGHRVLDLGADEFTVGRPHPMIDHGFLLRRLREEAANPRVAVILLDVVLGDGAHADPAGDLAPAIAAALQHAGSEGRELALIVALIGTAEDPQGLTAQSEGLAAAGASVVGTVEEAVAAAWAVAAPGLTPSAAAPGSALTAPRGVINVGVELFHDALRAQGIDVLHVDWRPPARGNERLAGILERMRR